jgi:putative flippase GtrA
MIHRELFRYAVKGGAFVALNIAVQIALVESGTLRPEWAALVSTALMPLGGYVAMNRFVFRTSADGLRGHAKRFVQYVSVNYTSKVANYALFLAFLWLGLWYPLAYLLGAALVFLATFAINRRLWLGGVTA